METLIHGINQIGELSEAISSALPKVAIAFGVVAGYGAHVLALIPPPKSETAKSIYDLFNRVCGNYLNARNEKS